MKVTRRQTMAGLMGAAASLSLPGRLSAQAGPILHASWGGGVGDTWTGAFAGPFEAETGTSVRIVEVPNPEAQFRAQAGNPQYHTGIGTFVQGVNLMRDDMLETFDIEEIPAMKNIPEEYWLKTEDGRLAGITPYFAYYGIAVNTDEASIEDFSSWKSLADEKWKGRLGMTRPIYLSTYDLTILSKAAGGDEKNTDGGMKLLEGMSRNVLNVSNSLAQQNTMLERGEVAAMPFYSVRVWSLNEAGVDHVKIVIPDEGALLLPYVVVAPKGVSDRERVAEWLNFIASPEPQERGMEISGYIPANSEAEATDEIRAKLGMTFQEVKDRLYQPDWGYIAAHQKETVAEIDQMLANL
ncbi:ABC transporter substrate-binding protein [Pseudooceanicola nanhaiensis]|jgi:putative spermidine/putrescine transport system substrate-binding protein|uniref:ABC transporter substrate-binding protein n=1 Tax=Pseudooceanicola nanhaiensis TaxID=375761 RepID=A0A917WL29_9RHOB|nr:extracellular solute-binding protein [Pseudooceanicola nanhaiensis]GGM12711.1 ABC transporter substrate-binding protein [Pseudooceanicola nanhaiensis]